MKKKLILLCLGVFLLCGCEAKQEISFKINEDKSMDVKMFIGYDDALVDALMDSENDEESGVDISGDNLDETDIVEETEDTEKVEYTDEDRKKYVSENVDLSSLGIEVGDDYVAEVYQDDKYTGYIITKKVDNIDDLVGTPDFSLEDVDNIDNKKIFTKEKGVYKANITFDSSDEDSYSSEYGIGVKSNFIVELPNEAISSNATSVSEDGKTLTWDLTSGNISTIEFAFEFPSLLTFLKDNIILVAIIAVVVVLAIVVIVTLLLKKSKNNNQDSFDEVNKLEQPVMQKNTDVVSNEINSTLNTVQNLENSVNNQAQTVNNSIPVQNPAIDSIQPVIEPQPVVSSVEQQVPVIEPQPVVNPVEQQVPVIEPQPVVSSVEQSIPVVQPIMPEQVKVEQSEQIGQSATETLINQIQSNEEQQINNNVNNQGI